MPEAAQTTFLGACASAFLALSDFTAVPWADFAAAVGAIFAVVEATLTVFSVDLVVLLTAPPLAVCTTMSPPSTGRPA